MMTIGERIKARRTLSGMSIRQAADRAGISHSSWSRIERGLRGADNRFVLADIARTLRCSIPDLTGSAGEVPATPEEALLSGNIHSLLAALVETDLDDGPTVAAVSLEALGHEGAVLDEMRMRADYVGVVARLAPHIRQLHATTVSATTTQDKQQGLRLTVLGCVRASGILREVGQKAEAYLAGERAREAAEELGEPVMYGAAARIRAAAAMGCGSMARACKIADAGLSTLDGHLDDYGAKEVAGHLHLVSAMSLYGLHQPVQADHHLAEASDLAAFTGDTDTFNVFFGPTNLRFWRLAITVDAGDPREALEIARHTTPGAMKSIDRQGMFYLDSARALSRIGTRDSDAAAVRMLLTAERLTPQRLRMHPFAKETLRQIIERAKRSAIDAKLRGLCERIGIAK